MLEGERDKKKKGVSLLLLIEHSGYTFYYIVKNGLAVTTCPPYIFGEDILTCIIA